MKSLETLVFMPLILLSACVSYAPESVPPTFSYSPETLQLATPAASTSGVDFGMELRSNESDSLSNVETLPGVKVVNVHLNGPADGAGIQSNDVILTIAGTATNDPDVIESYARQATTEQAVQMTLRRDTTVLEATVQPRKLTASTPLRELHRVDPIATRASYTTEIVALSNGVTKTSARVVEIADASPLALAGIEVGDRIFAIDSQPIGSAQDLINRVNQSYPRGASVTLQLQKGKATVQRKVKLWSPKQYVRSARLFPLFYFERNRDTQTTRFKFPDIIPLYSYDRTERRTEHRFLFFFAFKTKHAVLSNQSND